MSEDDGRDPDEEGNDMIVEIRALVEGDMRTSREADDMFGSETPDPEDLPSERDPDGE